MAPRNRTPAPPLFDLPLVAEPESGIEDEPGLDFEEQEPLPFPDDLEPELAAEPEAFFEPEAEAPGPEPAAPPARPRSSLFVDRLKAGLTDLAVLAGVLLAILAGLWVLGRPPQLGDGPAIALFLLTFSFLYVILPLSFFGQTAGMASVDLQARTGDGRPLAFRQSVLRWLGAVMTVALAGLPLLVALSGRSLADRLSASVTRSTRTPG